MAQERVVIKSSSIAEIKRYYLGMYHSYLIDLYDKGYISDPTIYNIDEIKENIEDLGIDLLKGRQLTSRYLSFVHDYYTVNHKDAKDEIEFLDLLEKMHKMKEISENLDCLWEDKSIGTESKKKVCLMLPSNQGVIKNPYSWNIDEGVLKSAYGLRYTYRFISWGRPLLSFIKTTFKLPSLDLIKSFNYNLLIKHLPLILNGDVELTGKDGRVLEAFMEKETTLNCHCLKDWLLANKGKDIDLIYKKCKVKKENVKAMVEDGLYVQEIADIELPISHFIFATYDFCHNKTEAFRGIVKGLPESSIEVETLLPKANLFLGYSGQVYSLEYLEHNKINYAGVPISLYKDDKTIEKYVDFEQTELASKNTLFKEYGAVLEFTDSQDLHFPEKMYTPAEAQIVDGCKEINRGKTRVLVQQKGRSLTARTVYSLTEKVGLLKEDGEDIGL